MRCELVSCHMVGNCAVSVDQDSRVKQLDGEMDGCDALSP